MTDEVKKSIHEIENVFHTKAVELMSATYALHANGIRRYSNNGTRAQILVNNVMHMAEALGVVDTAPVPKETLEKVLPFLELLSEVSDKLTNDALRNINVTVTLLEILKVDMTLSSLTPTNLAALRARYL